MSTYDLSTAHLAEVVTRMQAEYAFQLGKWLLAGALMIAVLVCVSAYFTRERYAGQLICTAKRTLPCGSHMLEARLDDGRLASIIVSPFTFAGVVPEGRLPRRLERDVFRRAHSII